MEPDNWPQQIEEKLLGLERRMATLEGHSKGMQDAITTLEALEKNDKHRIDELSKGGPNQWHKYESKAK